MTAATPATAATTDGPQPSYEQARAELMEVVAQLESGQASLADSLALWERGQSLAAVCQSWLDAAQARLDAAQPGAGQD